MQSLNIHPASAYEPRVSDQKLLKTLAKAAFRNIPNSQPIIDKHFNQEPKLPELLPPKPKNLVFHGPY